MNICQRDIVEVPFNLPQGTIIHPVIVLSNTESIKEEDSFIGLMITSEKNQDLYSFEITPEMVSKPLPKYSQARVHLISFFRVNEVVSNSHYNNKLKPEYFKQLINRINIITFDLE